MPNKKNTFLITIDVEDWFQVENFKSYIPQNTWGSCDLRVERNTHKLLDLFDEAGAGSGKDPKSGSWEEQKKTNVERRMKKLNVPSVRTTFFILGWIAERLPNLVREINDRGHEVASHGFGHEMCNRQSPADLIADLKKSKELLENRIGEAVHGYRAPSFSVDKDILTIIEDAGYRYDSSYNSFDKHGRYGKLATNGFQRTGIAYQISDSFHELPVSNLLLQPSTVNRQPVVLPWAGGGYFRLIPDAIFNMGVQSILEKEDGYLFYLHPWEIDPSQPRVKQASTFFKFRHYVNLHKTEKKLKKMISRFKTCRFSSCGDYLASTNVQI